MQRAARIPRIIDDLYAGTLDPAAWSRALVAIADLVSGIDALLLAYDGRSSTVPQEETHRFDGEALGVYKSDWVAKDVRLPLAVRAPVDEPQFESKLLPLRVWRNSEIYCDFMRHHDVTTFLCTWLDKSPERVVALTIQGGSKRGPFGAKDAELIRPLLPHVRRAIEIRDRLRLAEVKASSLLTCLDSSPFALMVLDVAGRVIEMSAAARTLVNTESLVRCGPGGRLSLPEPAGSELARWLHTGHPPTQNRDGWLRIPRLGKAPLSLLASRVPVAETLWLGGSAPAWLVLLFDPDRELVMSLRMLALDLGISVREAQVAASIAAGREIGSIAAELDISVHTARSHLKSVYAKTGLASRADLLRRIAVGPAAAVVPRVPPVLAR